MRIGFFYPLLFFQLLTAKLDSSLYPINAMMYEYKDIDTDKMEDVMKRFMLNIITAAISTTLFITFPTQACTDFKLTAKDGTLLITRSMEFGIDTNSSLRTSPEGRVFNTTSPNNKPGLTWKAKYGYVYLDGFGMDVSLDGMNTAGLTFEFLYLPGETTYQTLPAGKDSQALPYIYFGDWVLGNFKTIDEVKQALTNIYVVAVLVPSLGSAILPGHASIYDASGKGIVVEFYNNQINVYDNIGVMTNSPKYDWHVTNLRNYINLSPNNPSPIIANGIIYASTGQGSGMVGLPGDASPPSRFVKTATLVKNTFQAETATDVLNLAEHIINNVDLPNGLVRSTDNAGKVTSDITEWVVFKDVTHKIIYYRTYNDMSLRSVSFDQLDFTEKAPRLKMPLTGTPNVMDMNTKFKNSKAP